MCLGADTFYQDAVAYIKTCSMDPEQEAKYINELLDVNRKLDYVLEEVQNTKTTSVPLCVKGNNITLESFLFSGVYIRR